MAFMTVPSAASSITDSTPVLGYNAKSGRWFLLDRIKQDDGEWCTQRTDVTMARPEFAIDFGRLEVGFIHFARNRAPLWALAPYGASPVAEPEPAAESDKPMRYKPGFRVPVLGRAIGGVREFAGNSAALIAAMNDLHSVLEESPDGRAGKIPLVTAPEVMEVQAGQATNYQPVFVVKAWVERPAVLGPRTVAPPGAPRIALRGGGAPARMAQPATRYGAAADPIAGIHQAKLATQRPGGASDGPPADRWGDTPAPGARPINGTATHVTARVRF